MFVWIAYVGMCLSFFSIPNKDLERLEIAGAWLLLGLLGCFAVWMLLIFGMSYLYANLINTGVLLVTAAFSPFWREEKSVQALLPVARIVTVPEFFTNAMRDVR